MQSAAQSENDIIQTINGKQNGDKYFNISLGEDEKRCGDVGCETNC